MSTLRKEVVSGLFLLLAGIGYLLYSSTYSLDTLNNPGPGVFPLFVGGVLILLIVCQMVKAVKASKKQAFSRDARSREKPVETKPLLLILIFAGYLLLMKWIGFFTANSFFVILSSRLIGARDWGRPVLLAAGVGLFCYLLFVVWLKLSLPRGFLF